MGFVVTGKYLGVCVLNHSSPNICIYAWHSEEGLRNCFVCIVLLFLCRESDLYLVLRFLWVSFFKSLKKILSVVFLASTFLFRAMALSFKMCVLAMMWMCTLHFLLIFIKTNASKSILHALSHQSDVIIEYAYTLQCWGDKILFEYTSCLLTDV